MPYGCLETGVYCGIGTACVYKFFAASTWHRLHQNCRPISPPSFNPDVPFLSFFLLVQIQVAERSCATHLLPQKIRLFAIKIMMGKCTGKCGRALDFDASSNLPINKPETSFPPRHFSLNGNNSEWSCLHPLCLTPLNVKTKLLFRLLFPEKIRFSQNDMSTESSRAIYRCTSENQSHSNDFVPVLSRFREGFFTQNVASGGFHRKCEETVGT